MIQRHIETDTLWTLLAVANASVAVYAHKKRRKLYRTGRITVRSNEARSFRNRIIQMIGTDSHDILYSYFIPTDICPSERNALA